MDNKYLQDLHEIKTMMNKSSQFISLSGPSGILAGVYALIGAWFTHVLLAKNTEAVVTLESGTFKAIVLIAAIVLTLSVVTAVILSSVKAKKEGEKIWNTTSRRLFINFLIPLVTGGLFAVLLIKNGTFGLIAPVTLIFYGLACVNASKYTLRDIRYLGITVTILGLLATNFPGHGLLFWALGFGVCHVIYGTIMYVKYDRKN